MKSKISMKLIMYFSIALLLFSIIIGSVFTNLFKEHAMTLRKSELEERAITMADTLSDLMGNQNNGRGMMGTNHGGYGVYLQFLEDIAMTDVWIVDENLELITIGHMMNQQYNYVDLPQDAEKVVDEVFQGNTTFSEGFSEVYQVPTLTVGTPISLENSIIGTLLLHTPVEEINDVIYEGFEIFLISMIIALFIVFILSIILASSFTKPLKKMKNTALKLVDGEYRSKTGIKQNDEIGELALTLDVLSDRLDIASREGEKLERLRQEFVANISHELRTPITIMRGSLEALNDEVVTEPEQIKSYIHQMLNESKFLQRLVNDLLDLSRLQNIDFKIEMEKLNLCDVIQDVLRSGEQIAKLKNIKLDKKIDASMLVIIGDYGRLRQMLLIILENAIKFSMNGDVIRISLENNRLSIEDNGVGIPNEGLPYIFDRYYKTDVNENNKGTGLGLAIAKQIADRHDIKILVKSEEHQGTRFEFYFKKEEK